MQVVKPIASVSATRNETLARQHFLSRGVLYRSQELVKNSGSMVGLMEKSPRLMSIPTVAETLDVSRSTVYRMINDGDLLAVTVRSFKRVSVASVERFINKRERSARLGEEP